MFYSATGLDMIRTLPPREQDELVTLIAEAVLAAADDTAADDGTA
jgi:hypothetical protein